MPEPGTNHATIAELRAAAAAVERSGLRDSEVQTLVQTYRAKLAELGAGQEAAAWVAAKAAVTAKSPPASDAALEAVKAFVLARAALEPAYYAADSRRDP